MKRTAITLSVLLIITFINCERETRTVIVPPPPEPSCQGVQSEVDTYTTGDLTIPAGCSVIVTRTLRVSRGTLTVESGAHLYFDFGGGIVIDEDGAIRVLGTPSQTVIFTSAYEPPYTGDWAGITIYSTDETNSISYARIEYAEVGIALYGDVEVENSEFMNNFYGFRTEAIDTYFSLDGSVFSGNDYALYLYSDTITLLSDNIYLEPEDEIYVDGSDGIINSGSWPSYTYVFLTDVIIQNATQIDVSNAHIFVEPPYEIIVKDNSLFTADNVYFGTNSPYYECWGGISFEGADPLSYIIRSTISDGGAGYYKANVSVVNTYSGTDKLYIADSEISYSCGDGVYIYNSDVYIENSIIHDNAGSGIYVDCGSTLIEDIEDSNQYYGNGNQKVTVNPDCP